MSALGVGIYALVGLAVIVAGVWSLFVRRHGETDQPAAGWIQTDEVFVDPATSRRMRVWSDPLDGSRHYVPES